MLEYLSNPYFQVAGIALLVGLVLLFVSLFSKRMSTNRLLVLITLLLVCGGAIFFGLVISPENEKKTGYDQSAADRYFAAKFAEAGLYDKAIEALEEASALNEKAGDVLALARIYTLKKDYTKASLYYRKYVKSNGGDPEITLEAATVRSLNDAYFDPDDNSALIQIIEDLGMNPEDAGYIRTSSGESTVEIDNLDDFTAAMLKKLVEKADEELSKDEEKSAIKRAAETMVLIFETELKISRGEIDANFKGNTDFVEAAQKLNRAVRTDGLLAENTLLRNTTLIANAYLGSADDIAKNISDKATIDELVVASELCIGGYVTEKAFKMLPPSPNKKDLTEVYNQCMAAKSQNQNGLSKAEAEYYKALLGLIKNSNTNYIIKNILSLLAERSKDADVKDRSQAYLQLAKGFEYAEMKEQVDGYIDLALESANSAKDSIYADSMEKVLQFVVDENSSGDVTSYIRTALTRLMPVPMSNFAKLSDSEALNGGFIKLGLVDELVNGLVHNIENILVQHKVTINLGKVDYSNFPNIKLRVGFGSNTKINIDNAKDMFVLTDTNFPVTDLEIKEIPASETNIILLCDNSGSMSRDITNLKNAIYAFAEGMSGEEKVMVVAFDSSILFKSDFLTKPEDVKAYADQMSARGGTNIYGSVMQIATEFSANPTANNIIIVMSDGQDGNKRYDEITSGINSLTVDYNATIYSVALGSADTNYLSKIANAGNGRMLSVSSSADLASFYTFIHGQVGNQYEVSYTCTELDRQNRVVKINLLGSIGLASKPYYLQGTPVADEEDFANSSTESSGGGHTSGRNPKVTFDNNSEFTVKGFDINSMASSKQAVKNRIIGTGFKKDVTYQVRIEDKLRPYELKATFISSTELEVTLPANLSQGDYKLTVADKKSIITVDKALNVYLGEGVEYFKFGSYSFTADKMTKQNDTTLVLSGNVVMNGWLQFAGDVTFTGMLDDAVSTSVKMSCPAGSYVQYSTETNNGFTNLIAAAGVPIYFPAISVKLYNGKYIPKYYKDFSVEAFTITPIGSKTLNCKYVTISKASFKLYPDMLYTEAADIKPTLPSLTSVLKNFEDKGLTGTLKGGFVFKNSEIVIDAEGTIKYKSSNTKVGALPISFSELRVKFKSIDSTFEIGASVALDGIKVKGAALSGVGLDLGWKYGSFNMFKLSCDVDKLLCAEPVPVTLKKFSVGATNIAEAVKKTHNPLDATITGGFDITVADLETVLPEKANDAITKLFSVDKPRVAAIKDAELKITLAKFNIDFKAKLELFGLDFGGCRVQIGKYNLISPVMNLDTTEYGLDVQLTVGPNISKDNFTLRTQAAAHVAVGYPYTGLDVSGDFFAEARWFVFDFSVEAYGDFGLGIMKNELSELQFSVKAYYEFMEDTWFHGQQVKYGGFRVDISKSKGFDVTTY